MKKKRSSLDKNSKILYGTAVLIIVAVVFIAGFLTWKQNKAEKEKITKGTAYLESLANQDIEPISERIDSIRTEQRLALMSADENAVWQGFDNAVILGDSRAVGFYFHEFVPEERVMAKGGGKITDVSEYIEQLKALNPKQIFLCYGLNDVGIGFWPEPADYAAECEKQITLLQTELPDSTIYLNSILPAVGVGIDADPDYARIGDYNTALKGMAEEKGYHYIDNTQIAEKYKDLYQPDGLHVETEFYKYWAANMLTEVKE